MNRRSFAQAVGSAAILSALSKASPRSESESASAGKIILKRSPADQETVGMHLRLSDKRQISAHQLWRRTTDYRELNSTMSACGPYKDWLYGEADEYIMCRSRRYRRD